MRQELPLLVVIGATGTGKSKLAIDVAKHVAGQVINADTLQVRRECLCLTPLTGSQLYQGLPIVTNKVTEEEMCRVRHHLLGFMDPFLPLTVLDFRKMALQVVSGVCCLAVLLITSLYHRSTT